MNNGIGTIRIIWYYKPEIRNSPFFGSSLNMYVFFTAQCTFLLLFRHLLHLLICTNEYKNVSGQSHFIQMNFSPFP